MLHLNFTVSSEAFHADVFEQKPSLFRGAFYAQPEQSWAAFDAALQYVDPTADFVKLMLNGRIPQDHFVEDFMDIGVRRRRLRKDVLYKTLGEGATLAVNRLDISSPYVADICMQVSRFVNAQATANGYVSFGAKPGTKPHWDTHDVFAVQLAGRKRWRLYQPSLPLPLSSQSSTEHLKDLPDAPFLEAVIEAGDVLYVPRGWWHRVEPVDGSHTFHLAVGVHSPLILDYLIWACANVLPEMPEVRHGMVDRPGDLERIRKALALLTEALANKGVLTDFYSRARARERVVSNFEIGGLFCSDEAGWDGDRTLQLNSRYAPGNEAITINGQSFKPTDIEREVLDLVIRTPFSYAEALSTLTQRFAPAHGEALRGLITADILSLRSRNSPPNGI